MSEIQTIHKIQTSKNLLLSLASPAKINRFMRIVSQRADGMHQLQTLFQFIDLADTLNFYQIERVDKNMQRQPKISTNLDFIDGVENIVLQAARLLLKEYESKRANQSQKVNGAYANSSFDNFDNFDNLDNFDNCNFNTNFDIHIEIQKNIPTGAGLGGGSSNAATCLLGLNKILQMGFDDKQLANIGLKLGADVPIFIYGKSAYAEGVGDLLKDASNINCPLLVLLYPGLGCNTKTVFQSAELERNNPPLNFDLFKLDNTEIPKLNDATSVVKKQNPALAQAWKWLENQGLEVQLTGTGACIFAEVENKLSAIDICKNMPKNFAGFEGKIFVVQTLNYSHAKAELKNQF